MYGYGNSDNNWVIIIIGVIIGAIILFLICRELVCWYWKINRIIVLLEEQNNLLRQQLENSFVAIIKEFIPTHKVKLLTNADGLGLRKSPNPSIDSFTKLPDGTEIRHLSTGDEIKLQDKEGFWYEIITKAGTRGWCFSGSLEKI
jgi:hypothetical protein